MTAPATQPLSSRYHFTERRRGFTIEGEGRPTVSVEFTGFWFLVRKRQSPECPRPGMPTAPVDAPVNQIQPTRARDELWGYFAVYDFPTLCRSICQAIMSDWEPRPAPAGAEPGSTWGGARDWAFNNTCRALTGRIHRQWKRLLALADPAVLRVNWSVFAACYPMQDYIPYEDKWALVPTWRELYLDTNLVPDVVKYRAAAIALGRWRDFPSLQAYAHLDASQRKNRVYVWPVFKELINWPQLYSCFEHSYPELEATLARLPGGVPAGLVTQLHSVKLNRPITDRAELGLLLTAISEVNNSERHPSELVACNQPDLGRRYLHIFMNATAPEIKEAMARMATSLDTRFTTRHMRSLRWFARILLTTPECPAGGILELCDQHIKWRLRDSAQHKRS